MPSYLEHLLFLLAFYVASGVSLSWSVKYAGSVSLFGGCALSVGAYTAAYMPNQALGSWLVHLAIASGAGVFFLAAVFLLFRKLRGDWFVIGSLAVQVMTIDVLYNMSDLTNGALGVQYACWNDGGCLDRSRAGLLLQGLAALIVVVHLCLWRNGFLVRLAAMRDNEDLFRWLGFNPAIVRATLGMLTGGLFSVIGFVYGSYYRFVEPSMFDLRVSVAVLLVVIVGGGGFWGAILGSVVVLSLQEGLRFLPIASAGDAFLREVVFGVVLAGIVFRRVSLGRDLFSGGRGVSL